MNAITLFMGVATSSRSLDPPVMKSSSSLLFIALFLKAGPILIKSASTFSPLVYPLVVSSSQECLLDTAGNSQSLTNALTSLQASLPPPQLQENCDTTEKLFKEYPNVELAYFNATMIFPPTILPMEVTSKCTGDVADVIDSNFTAVLQDTIDRLAFGGASCPDIVAKYPSARSGLYTIKDGDGQDITVYCDMDGDNCDGVPGWMRLSLIDMTTLGTKCPQGLNTMDTGFRKYCGRFESGAGCVSTSFGSLGHNYTHVCGRVRGFQHGSTDAFYSSVFYSQTLEGWYVDGVSFTYGSPRSHIWTYAAGLSESLTQESCCPCNYGFSNASLPPSFIGEDYYCESGNPEGSSTTKLYSLDYLWDGVNCDGIEGGCCISPKMPWFSKTLAQTIKQDIELRVCTREEAMEGVYIDLIEIFVR